VSLFEGLTAPEAESRVADANCTDSKAAGRSEEPAALPCPPHVPLMRHRAGAEPEGGSTTLTGHPT
jgi:hypothetical protein